MADFPVLVVAYLIPIAYCLGFTRGITRVLKEPVPLNLYVWIAFWPAILIVQAFKAIREAIYG